MTTVRPFPASVVDPAWAERVVSPMHDTISAEARAEILATNPYSYLNVTRGPEEGEDPDAVVEDNAASLQRLLDDGAFGPPAPPALYAYRLRTEDHRQTGLVVEIPAMDFASGCVLGHEAVHPDRVAALVRHFARVPARSDLVALMYERDQEIEGVVKACCEGPPMLDVTSVDGVAQTVWRLDDLAAIGTVARRLEPQTLYVTDGHHRVAASLELWERQGRPQGHGVLCVLFPDEELRVLAFHRRVAGPLDAADTLARLRARASIRPLEHPRVEAGVFQLYLDGRWHSVVPRDRPARAGREGLDVAWLHAEVLEPIFDVNRPDDGRLEVASELVPIADLTSRCDADGGALFLLHTPTLAQIVEVADRREVMPPKATYFDPKPRSGVFLRSMGRNPV